MERTSPRVMATQITRLLKKQRPDTHYLKKLFEYIRQDLDLKGQKNKSHKLPELLTEEELKRFYTVIFKSFNRSHIVMIKVLLYTGVRNAELVNLKLTDVDLDGMKLRIEQGKGQKDRYVPIPGTFQGELGQYVSIQKEKNSKYLFESRRHDKYSTRTIRVIIKNYAEQAGIEKRMYPHLFRHQFLTYLTQKGIIDAKIQLISGHKTRQSLEKYQELSLADVIDEYNDVMKDFPIK